MGDLETSEGHGVGIWRGFYYSVEVVKYTGITSLVTSRAYAPSINQKTILIKSMLNLKF